MTPKDKLKLADKILAWPSHAFDAFFASNHIDEAETLKAILTEWKELKHIFCEVVEISKGLPPMSEYNLKGE